MPPTRTTPPPPPPQPERHEPTPFAGWGQLGTNVVSNWHPIDWTKRVVGSAAQAALHPVDTVHALGNALDAATLLKDAAWHDRNGKWPSNYTDAQKQQANQIYQGVMPHFTWVDRSGGRHIDPQALVNIASKSPMDILAFVASRGSSALGALGLRAEETAAAARMLGQVRRPAILSGASTAANVGSKALKLTSTALNPVPATVAKTIKVTAPTVAHFVKADRAFGPDGNFTSKAQDAMKEAGLDPAHYQDDVSRQIFTQTVAQEGVSPQAMKKAAVRAAVVPENASPEDIAAVMKSSPTRSMIEGTMRPSGRLGAASAERQIALSKALGTQEAAAQQQASDIGASIRRGVGQNEAFTDQPVHPDVALGLRQHLNASLTANGMPTLEYMAEHPGAYPDVAAMLNRGKDAGLRAMTRWETGAQPIEAASPEITVNTHFGRFTKTNEGWTSPVTGLLTPSQSSLINTLEEEAARAPKPEAPPSATMPTPRDILDTLAPGEGKGKDAGVAFHIRQAAEDYLLNQLPPEAAEALQSEQRARQAFSYGFGNEAPPPEGVEARAGQLSAARKIVGAPEEATEPSALSGEPNRGPAKRAVSFAAGALSPHPFLSAPIVHLADRLMSPDLTSAELAPVYRPQVSMSPGQTNLLRAAGLPTADLAGSPQPVAPAPQAAPQAAPAKQGGGDEWVEQALKPSPHQRDDDWVAKALASGDRSVPQEKDALYRDVFPDEAPPQESTGGRVAYKKGGVVKGDDIEPLVRALMGKAKKAKVASNKATEPLLNSHDNAIASALAVAQKAI